MKCPTCGTENKTSNKACFRCGATLADGGVTPRGTANAMWSTPQSQKNPTQPPPFWADAGKRPADYEGGKDFVVLSDEEDDVHVAADLKHRGVPLPDNRKKLRDLSDGREIDVVVPPRAKRSRVTRSRYRVNWRRFAVMAVVITALSAALAYGLFTGYKWSVGAVSQWFADRNGTVPAQEPLVERELIDGNVWHKITFYGKDGEQVLVSNPRRSLTIREGKAELLLDDQSFIPTDLSADEDKVTVELKATIFSTTGEEREVHIDPYDIKVPLSPLKIILPKDQTTPTEEDRVLVKVKVTPGSRVLIGKENRTDQVDKQGYVSYYVPLEAIGVNEIVVTVETKKYRKNNFTLKITRPKMDVPITLDSTLDKKTTQDSTVEIKGTTDPGATITTDTPLAGKSTIEMDPATGNFSFTATLQRWGMNRIRITATAANGITSSMVHCVTREATLENYTKKAQVMDYAYVSSAADNIIGRVYLFEGYVQQKLENEDSDYYLFNIGTKSSPQVLVLEYTKESGLKTDQYYKVFGDVIGSVDNYPALTGQFVYEIEPPDGASASPTTSATADATATPEAEH